MSSTRQCREASSAGYSMDYRAYISFIIYGYSDLCSRSSYGHCLVAESCGRTCYKNG